LYRAVPDEEQNSIKDDLTQPGLCLAKTHPWLSYRKNAYTVFGETANLTAWLNQVDTKAALQVD